MLVFVVWIILFCINGLNTSYVPMITSKYQEVVGVVMFNFAFVTTIPSWINIKIIILLKINLYIKILY